MVFWVCGNYIPRLVTLTLIDLQGHIPAVLVLKEVQGDLKKDVNW